MEGYGLGGHEPSARKGIYRQPKEQGQVSSFDRGRRQVIRSAFQEAFWHVFINGGLFHWASLQQSTADATPSIQLDKTGYQGHQFGVMNVLHERPLARLKEGITQKKLSELTGIPQSHISEMENSRRQIGKKRAKLLAKALNVGYKVLL